MAQTRVGQYTLYIFYECRTVEATEWEGHTAKWHSWSSILDNQKPMFMLWEDGEGSIC